MNALTQALQRFSQWATPKPVSPIPEQKRTSILQPGGLQQAVNNVVAKFSMQPQLIRPFATSTPTQKKTVSTPTPTPTIKFNEIWMGKQQPKATTTPTRIPIRTTSPTTSPTATPGQAFVGPPRSTVTPTAAPAGGYPGRNQRFANYPIAPNVRSALDAAAKQFNLPPGILYDVAAGETTFNPTIVNQTPAGVAAGNPAGLFQFTDPTWQTVLKQYNNRPGMALRLPNTDRFDPMTSALAAAYLISRGQLGRWDASRHEGVNKWGPFYSQEELDPYYVQTLGYQK